MFGIRKISIQKPMESLRWEKKHVTMSTVTY
jgi:hypothetical protein